MIQVTEDDIADARRATLGLLAHRAAGATICPSEVARHLAAASADADWRGRMPIVHAAVDRLMAEERIVLGWKGKPLAVRTGPYRIGRADAGR